MQNSCIFFLNADVGAFRAWLQNYSRRFHGSSVPTQNGYICLQRAWAYETEAGCALATTGIYVLNSGNRQEAYDLGAVIEFSVQLLAVGRIEVSAKCNHPGLVAVFGALLAEIERRWPETRVDIDAYLKGLGQAEPAEEAERVEDKPSKRQSAPVPDGLSQDERTIWAMYEAGDRVRDIADAVSIAEGTVANKLGRLFTKGLAPRQQKHWKRQKIVKERERTGE